MSGYYDRALKARDPRYARVLEKMGYGRKDMVAAEPEPAPEVIAKPKPQGAAEASETTVENELKQLRSQYEAAFGKKPFNGWGAETLREKLAEAA